jgi:hypothetical protein
VVPGPSLAVAAAASKQQVHQPSAAEAGIFFPQREQTRSLLGSSMHPYLRKTVDDITVAIQVPLAAGMAESLATHIGRRPRRLG